MSEFVAGKRLFLSGPMDSIPGFNHAAFNAAAAKWRKVADCIWNPAELFDGDTGRRRIDYQRQNLAELTRLSGAGSYYDGLLLLPGWTHSRGSRLEIRIAVELCMQILCAEYGIPVVEAMRFGGGECANTTPTLTT